MRDVNDDPPPLFPLSSEFFNATICPGPATRRRRGESATCETPCSERLRLHFPLL
uniref:Uncharacterized protein n=1 Tax=Triticum urartu TaxID=4572 RepID=A0A8R7PT43_TRIUA